MEISPILPEASVAVLADPGLNGTEYFFDSFRVKVTGLHAGYNLHFDLYTTKEEQAGGVGINRAGPFSNDAGTNHVPEFLTSTLFVPIQQLTHIEQSIKEAQAAPCSGACDRAIGCTCTGRSRNQS